MLVPGTRIPLPYRQEATFFYLTGVYDQGCHEAVCALELNATGEKLTYRLFVNEDDEERVRWEGPRLGVRDAKDLQCDVMETLPNLPRYLHQVKSQNRPLVIDGKMWKGHAYAKHVYQNTPGKGDGALLPVYTSFGSTGRGGGIAPGSGTPLGTSVIYDTLEQTVHALRWKKTEHELDMMRCSAQITTRAFQTCMRNSHPSMNEREISSLFEFLCKSEGAQRMPYPQVVAGGNSACTIHYSNNDRKVFDGEMVLMDAGCDFHGYVSDVTRTWPIGGKFTEPQREVYGEVLEAHRECLAQCVEGATLRDIHRTSVHLLSRSLSRLGIVQKTTQEVLLQGLYKPYYPHSIGHWLGMDTHDVHTVSATKPFEVGTVLTIEPGLYLPRNCHEIPAQYRGIGIRLEDDVVVQEGAPEVLSGGVPITPEDVEETVGNFMEYEGQTLGKLSVVYNSSHNQMLSFWKNQIEMILKENKEV